MLETRDSLVIAIAWLAYGPGAVDDNVDRQRRTGAEISPRFRADEGAGGWVAVTRDELALRLECIQLVSGQKVGHVQHHLGAGDGGASCDD